MEPWTADEITAWIEERSGIRQYEGHLSAGQASAAAINDWAKKILTNGK